MSVINQMLQDLEGRRNRALGDSSLSAQIRAVPRRGRDYRAWWTTLAVAVLAGIAVSAWWMLRPTQEAALGPDAVARTTAIIAASPTLEPEPDGAATLATRAEPNSTASPGATAAPSLSAAPSANTAPIKPIATRPAPSAGALEAPTTNRSALVSPAPMPAADMAREARSLQLPPPPIGKDRQRQALEATAATAKVSAPEPAAAPRDAAAVDAGADDRADERAEARIARSSGPTTVATTRQLTAHQRTENEYAKAMALAQAGQSAEAITSLGNVVQLEPGNVAVRQALVGLLVEAKQYGEAARRLQDGLALDPGQTGLAMILARLQVEQGDGQAARATLQRSLPHAAERPDYLAFLAALLQREGRNKEAIEQYQRALRSEPTSGVWLMGLGISLKAENRLDEARDSFNRAIASNSLSPDLRAYVEQQLK